MNKLNFRGSWNEVKGKLKQKYGNLTDDDLTFAEGKEEELLGRVQQRTGRAKEQLRKEIENCNFKAGCGFYPWNPASLGDFWSAVFSGNGRNAERAKRWHLCASTSQ